MATFTLTIPDSIRNMLTCQGVPEAVARGVMLTALDVRDLLAKDTPVDTGDTARRWQVIKEPTPQDPSAIVGNDSEVMVYLEYGTGIYSTFPGAKREVIRPKKAKALGPVNWMGEKGVFFAFVRGMRPTFTVRGSLDKIQALLDKNVQAEVMKLYG